MAAVTIAVEVLTNAAFYVEKLRAKSEWMYSAGYPQIRMDTIFMFSDKWGQSLVMFKLLLLSLHLQFLDS